MAYNLTYNLLNMFLKNQDWHMYHPNMVLEDNIRGEWSRSRLDHTPAVYAPFLGKNKQQEQEQEQEQEKEHEQV